MDTYAPDEEIPANKLEASLVQEYVIRRQAVERRMREQILSGNVEASPAGYKLSPQGREFVRWSRIAGALFGLKLEKQSSIIQGSNSMPSP